MKGLFCFAQVLSNYGIALCIGLFCSVPIQGVSAQETERSVVILRDANTNTIPDEIEAFAEELQPGLSCLQSDLTCSLAFTANQFPTDTQLRIRASQGCPSRRLVYRRTSEGTVVRQHIARSFKVVCSNRGKKKPAPKPKKPPVKPTVPAKKPTATPVPKATIAPPSSGGNAATGKIFYSQVCLSCHGIKAGKTEQQILAAMSAVSNHAPVKGLVSAQKAKDIAAYLATVR